MNNTKQEYKHGWLGHEFDAVRKHVSAKTWWDSLTVDQQLKIMAEYILKDTRENAIS